MARPRRHIDPARRAALEALRVINGEDGFANLVLKDVIAEFELDPQDAGFVTELVSTTCRTQGTLDRIIETAASRKLKTLQPAVIDVLRLAATQLLLMRVPKHAGVDTSVNLAGVAIGERTTGLVNAVSRKIGAKTFEDWIAQLSKGKSEIDRLAITTSHPKWIVQEYLELLPAAEVEEALLANNIAPVPTLVVRPGLAAVDELDGEAAKWSPYGAYRRGNPGNLAVVRSGKAGVQDEGSQLVTIAAFEASTKTDLPWLDMCAGPGGKAALLTGLIAKREGTLIAAELAPHRAKLVSQTLRAYPSKNYQVICADGTKPAWGKEAFSNVLLDAPCSGLGSLRRRPESRWRKLPETLEELAKLQTELLETAIDSVVPGGVVAYITCTPTRAETVDVVNRVLDRVEVLDAPALLPDVPDAAASTDPRFIQLWPHRHQTDAMFCALLKKK